MKWKLREQMDKYGDSLDDLAKYLKITYQTLSKKMNGHVEFTRLEIYNIKNRYDLNAEQLINIFFSN